MSLSILVSQLTASPSEFQALLLWPASALSLFALDGASSECTNAVHLSLLFSSYCTYSLSWFNNKFAILIKVAITPLLMDLPERGIWESTVRSAIKSGSPVSAIMAVQRSSLYFEFFLNNSVIISSTLLWSIE